MVVFRNILCWSWFQRKQVVYGKHLCIHFNFTQNSQEKAEKKTNISNLSLNVNSHWLREEQSAQKWQKAIYSYRVLFIIRFNLTNTEEPYFLVESLEALNSIDDINDRSYRVVVYAVNQKGQSPKIILKDFVIGDRDHRASGMYFEYFIKCHKNKPTRSSANFELFGSVFIQNSCR